MTTIQEYFNGIGDKRQSFICGCEFEIEDIKAESKVDGSKFVTEEDNSLRNNGREFKTHPNNFSNTLELFDLLHESLVLGPDPFSDRTSIHVHVNVGQLSINQVRQLVLTYALLEPIFFKFVGETRSNSIYCVPLNYTFLPSIYRKDIFGMLSSWHKYTAFNIKPINEIGTVEFRHLYGTSDRKVFTKWLTTLKELFEWVRDTEDWDIIKALSMNTPVQLAHMIIPTLARDYQQMELADMLKDTALDVKLSTGGLK